MKPAGREDDLYPPVRTFLRSYARTVLALPEHGETFADITAQKAGSGMAGGFWSRPDLALLVLTPGRILPTMQCDLHSFEVKTVDGLNEAAVHEAYAHTRLADFPWLAFQPLGRAEEGGDLWHRVLARAREYGVGVLQIADPQSPLAYRVALPAVRAPSRPMMVDQFVAERFSEAERARMARWLRARGWPCGAGETGEGA